MSKPFTDELCEMLSKIWDFIPETQEFAQGMNVMDNDEVSNVMIDDTKIILTNATTLHDHTPPDVEITDDPIPIKTLTLLDEDITDILNNDDDDDMTFCTKRTLQHVLQSDEEYNHLKKCTDITVYDIINEQDKYKVIGIDDVYKYSEPIHLTDIDIACVDVFLASVSNNINDKQVKRITYSVSKPLPNHEFQKLQVNQMKFSTNDVSYEEWMSSPLTPCFDFPIMAKLLNIPMNVITIRQNKLVRISSLSEQSFELKEVSEIDISERGINIIINDNDLVIPYIQYSKMYHITAMFQDILLPLHLCKDTSSYFPDEDKYVDIIIKPYDDPRKLYIAHRDNNDFLLIMPNLIYLADVPNLEELKCNNVDSLCDYEYNRCFDYVSDINNMIHIQRYYSLVSFISGMSQLINANVGDQINRGVKRANECFLSRPGTDHNYIRQNIIDSRKHYEALFNMIKASNTTNDGINDSDDGLSLESDINACTPNASTSVMEGTNNVCNNIEQPLNVHEKSVIDADKLFFDVIRNQMDNLNNRHNYTEFQLDIPNQHYKDLSSNIYGTEKVDITRSLCSILRQNAESCDDVLTIYAKTIAEYLSSDVYVTFSKYDESRLVQFTHNPIIYHIQFDFSNNSIFKSRYSTTHHASMQKAYNYDYIQSDVKFMSNMFINCYYVHKHDHVLVHQIKLVIDLPESINTVYDTYPIVTKGRPNYPNSISQNTFNETGTIHKKREICILDVERGHIINNNYEMYGILKSFRYGKSFKKFLFSEAPKSDETLLRIHLTLNSGQHVLMFTHVKFNSENKPVSTYLTLYVIENEMSNVHQALISRSVFRIDSRGPILYAANKLCVTGDIEKKIQPFFSILKDHIRCTGIRDRTVLSNDCSVQHFTTSTITPYILSGMSLRKDANNNDILSLSTLCKRNNHMTINKDNMLGLPCGVSVHNTMVDIHKHTCILDFYKLGLFGEVNNMDRYGFKCGKCFSVYPNEICALACANSCISTVL